MPPTLRLLPVPVFGDSGGRGNALCTNEEDGNSIPFVKGDDVDEDVGESGGANSVDVDVDVVFITKSGEMAEVASAVVNVDFKFVGVFKDFDDVDDVDDVDDDDDDVELGIVK
ncbi:hypothetical protein SAMD00019534_118010 [Acytostelium subglobosum LB1]|uniref:hypothetical protein n=1 Tax=Acytostelium subglobosum LB1 TaxID=1410327 RepID=UPI000644DA75|nr:hypothetical protein SAMD00019534_118010 [Acytostelium subglobosum LB1]GAM28625.1 hypothetical protein SAMD00019534_118010 [Acytostelium subglobosum LB1]|eukprot:XP_012748403.1 hypothetical protein SAMD00019534_118010 [Acytostelium subglobosum LB1]